MNNTRVIKIDSSLLDKEKLKEAVKILKEGGIVALPTDTIYGLAVNGLNKEAVVRLTKIKQRPKNKPFSLLISDIEMLEDLSIKVSALAKKYIDKFWPGALTLILKNSYGEKIGLRWPQNKIAQELIRECGVPLACPSANFSGEEPCINARQVKEKFSGLIELIIDARENILGKESSVIDLTVNPPKILREGAVSKEELERLYIC